MAVDIVARRPIGNHRIGDGIETGKVKIMDEELPGVVAHGGEEAIILDNDQCVEGNKHEEGNGCQQPFPRTDAKQCFH